MISRIVRFALGFLAYVAACGIGAHCLVRAARGLVGG